jgi:hypothetical protein
VVPQGLKCWGCHAFRPDTLLQMVLLLLLLKENHFDMLELRNSLPRGELLQVLHFFVRSSLNFLCSGIGYLSSAPA